MLVLLFSQDSNFTKHTDLPDLPACFQLSVLPWAPCIFLWLTSPFYIFYLKRNNRGYIMMSILNRIKTVLGLILWIVCWTDLFSSFHEMSQNQLKPPVYFVTPLVLGMTMLLATFLIQFERLKGVQSSGVLFIFWTISVLCAIMPFRSKIMNASQAEVSVFTMFYIYFGLTLLQLILSCFNEKPPLFSSVVTDPNVCPETTAGFLSKMTFWWFTRMAIKGYKSPLENKDLWSLNKHDSSELVVPNLLNEWEVEKSKAQRYEFRQIMIQSFSPRIEVLLSKRKEARQPSFLRALLRAFGPYFLIGSAFKLLQDLITFVNPQLLRMLIAFTKQPQAPSWWGYSLAFLMFSASLLQTLILHQHFQYCFVTGMRLRSGIVGAIYRKSLVITNEAKRSSTVGEVVNLMSVDAQRFMDLTTFLNMLWSAPLQIVLALFFLWQNLGPSVLAGVAVMVLLIPFNAFIAMKTRSYQVEQMKYKDERIKLMNEILNGIKVLKLYAWETSFKQKILQIRQKELHVLRKASYLSALSTMAWTSAPFLVALTTFAVFVTVDVNNILDAEKAFVSLSLFNILRFPLNMLPQVISSIVQASVSLKRIQGFLSHDELDPESVDRRNNASGNSPHSSHADLVCCSINVMVPQGSLLAVVGHVGCGKTSLVCALLGEMEKLEGQISIQGSVAYVPQQAWIQNATLRDNILFGRPYAEQKYRCVLEACALTPDLEVLPGGDQTEIGEKGINLSGGQRQRVSLARALYSGADVYLLDDPLSAVDAHVAKHIFDNVIGPEGALKGKTRILVTHGISFLPQVHNILVLVEGRVSEMGSYQDLLKQNGAFAEFLRNYSLEDIIEDDDVTVLGSVSCRQMSIMSNDPENPKKMSRRRRCSERRHLESPSEKKELKVEKLIQAETTETGRVKLKVYWEYAKAVGPLLSLFICVLYGCQSATSIGANVWLSEWTNDALLNRTQDRVHMRVGVYAALGISQGVLVMFSSFTLALGKIQAARKLHQTLLDNKFHTPQSFFDTTPIGRIINRFSKDIYVIDEVLPSTVLMFLGTFFASLSTMIVIIFSTPIFALVIGPLALIYFFVQRFYVATSRQLKRLESVSRSPIYSHFSETITGTSVIRAYGRNTAFVLLSDMKVWSRSRLDACSSSRMFSVFTVITMIIIFNPTYPKLSNASVTMSLNWMVRMTSDLESNIVAVERVKEYSETVTEAPWIVKDKQPPPDWPPKGNVEFIDYSVRYREGLDLVLRNISLEVKGGEKIGIVGRTGAGKSSMTLCLFRLLEAADGEIVIDEVKISEIGLHDLRSKLTIIPQEPVLFSGTLRMNLDPFEKYSEEDVWKVLELSHLKKFVSNQPSKLELECSEGGENLRCLVFKKKKILLLHQNGTKLGKGFGACCVNIKKTLIMIHKERVHMLNSVLFSCDRVLVLDKGKIAEFDTPTNLLAQKGIFYGMAKDAGLA
uniref:Canalicular multispecific organic anion transporter 2-like n=1 Tax=Sinocyclocheilus grahami TaxID=75366 RepID=A0A672Q8Y1_SINGR